MMESGCEIPKEVLRTRPVLLTEHTFQSILASEKILLAIAQRANFNPLFTVLLQPLHKSFL